MAAAQAAEARQEAEKARQARVGGGASSTVSSTPGGVDPNEVFKGVGEEKKDEPEDDDAEVDATGIEESDIKMVMDQGSVSRAKAVRALKETDSDVRLIPASPLYDVSR